MNRERVGEPGEGGREGGREEANESGRVGVGQP